MGQNNSIPNFAGQNLFKVMDSESFTVPSLVTVNSPAGASSGISPTTTFSSRRATVGGFIFAAVSDAAGPTSLDFQYQINPGDVIALSAAGATTTVSVNGTVVFSFAATAVAAVLGFYS